MNTLVSIGYQQRSFAGQVHHSRKSTDNYLQSFRRNGTEIYLVLFIAFKWLIFHVLLILQQQITAISYTTAPTTAACSSTGSAGRALPSISMSLSPPTGSSGTALPLISTALSPPTGSSGTAFPSISTGSSGTALQSVSTASSPSIASSCTALPATCISTTLSPSSSLSDPFSTTTATTIMVCYYRILSKISDTLIVQTPKYVNFSRSNHTGHRKYVGFSPL